MAGNNNTVQSWTGYYHLEDTGTESAANELDIIDSVFSRLEKMQKRITAEKIALLETQLAMLDNELTVFLKSELSYS